MTFDIDTASVTARVTDRHAHLHPQKVPSAGARRTAPHVLVIDDDQEMRTLTTEYLSAHKYNVTTAGDGASGLHAALTLRPDVVILDVVLPRLDGFDVLRRLRRESQAAVLLLSAKAEPEDRILGLTLGADDYLLKPVVGGELLARIRAILRRTQAREARVITVGTLHLDSIVRQAWAGTREIPLTTIEFDLLELLSETPGRIASRNTIARALYGRDTMAYERTIDVHVGHLRKKLRAADDVTIKTVRGTGYVLVERQGWHRGT